MEQEQQERDRAAADKAAQEGSANVSAETAAQAVADVLNEQTAAPQPEEGVPSEPVMLPPVSTLVIYHPRKGEIIRGRKEVAAIVVHRDEANGWVDLVAFHDAQDWRDCERVRPWPGGEERGFSVPQRHMIVPLPPGMNPGDMQAPGAVVWPDNLAMREITSIVDDVRSEVAKCVELVLGGFERPEMSVLDMINSLNERCDELEKRAVMATKEISPTKMRRQRPEPAKVDRKRERPAVPPLSAKPKRFGK
jgi:hypothetical protein